MHKQKVRAALALAAALGATLGAMLGDERVKERVGEAQRLAVRARAHVRAPGAVECRHIRVGGPHGKADEMLPAPTPISEGGLLARQRGRAHGRHGRSGGRRRSGRASGCARHAAIAARLGSGGRAIRRAAISDDGDCRAWRGRHRARGRRRGGARGRVVVPTRRLLALRFKVAPSEQPMPPAARGSVTGVTSPE